MTEYPYKGTNVDWKRTQGQITGLLYEYGAIGVSWSSYRGDDIVQFLVDLEIASIGVKKEIGFEVRPPKFMKRTGRKGDYRYTEDKDASYRALFWYLKTKLEAIRHNLVSFEREFTSNIMISLPDGKTTVGDIISGYIEKDVLESLPAPTKTQKQLIKEAKEISN